MQNAKHGTISTKEAAVRFTSIRHIAHIRRAPPTDSPEEASKQMPGAAANYYFGLPEVEEVALALHLLREGELLGDIGANIGAYRRGCRSGESACDCNGAGAIHFRGAV